MSSTSTISIDPESPYIERDLSWLQFNERVLAEALDGQNPLLERLKFLGITAANLDEFFMIRFASLTRELTYLARNLEANQQRLQRLRVVRAALLKSVLTFEERQARILETLTRELHRSSVFLWRDLRTNAKLHKVARDVFAQHVADQLRVPRHFGVQSTRQLMNLQYGLLFPDGMCIAVPKTIPNVFWKLMPDRGVAVFFLDDLLHAFAAESLGEEQPPCILRVTRDGDVELDLEDEDPESIPEVVRKRVGSREVRRAVRLQTSGAVLPSIETLLEVLRVPQEQHFAPRIPLSLSGVVSFVLEMRSVLPRKTRLLYPDFRGHIPIPFATPERILAAVRKQDYIFHQPYDSFDSYVHFISAAVSDPQVTAIYQTVYRIDALSPVVEMLQQVARKKQIVVIIEPRARFDEINNIKLAEDLRRAGAQVHFSTGALKLHAKLTLVVRTEGTESEMFTHLSTGNYNAKTARQYTDISIATAHPEIGEDSLRFFQAVLSDQVPDGLKRLVLAPSGLHRKILSHIRTEIAAAEAGIPARIFAKVNALVDRNVIEMLYRASQAGVQVDLVVRGACSLVPGVRGVSDNIRVISIVDRYLEHTRMYFFKSQHVIYFSSADWMPRNFFSRLEIAFPVLDERLFAFLIESVIPTYFRDGAKARMLNRHGQWHARTGKVRRDRARSQFVFEEMARRKYRGTALG